MVCNINLLCAKSHSSMATHVVKKGAVGINLVRGIGYQLKQVWMHRILRYFLRRGPIASCCLYRRMGGDFGVSLCVYSAGGMQARRELPAVEGKAKWPLDP